VRDRAIDRPHHLLGSIRGIKNPFPNRRASLIVMTEDLTSLFSGAYVKMLLVKTYRFLQPGDYILKKTSKRRAWTPTQVRELKSLARRKTPAKKIARTLKRSEGATRQKAFSMGLSLDSRM
jgi:hypothetical protein